MNTHYFTDKKIVFWGTAGVCIPFLKSLENHFDIKLIITQPDSLGGRGRKQIIPPVKNFALERGIDFIQPVTLKDENLIEKITSIEPAIGVVIAFGKIIPEILFSIPQYKTINVHYSLLPLYRGAAPVQRALQNGETKTGITIFELARGMDSGDIWAQKDFTILESDTTGILWERLSNEGAPFLGDTINAVLGGKITKTPQDHSKATYAREVRKEESIIDWRLNARQIVDKLRAFTPWPGLCCTAGGKMFKLTKLRVYAQEQAPGTQLRGKKPGDVLSMDKESLKVCCGENSLIEIIEIQPPGKKPMTPYNYCLGNKLPVSLG